MSRHAYGEVWHHAHCRPNHIGNKGGEEYPKRVRSPGPGNFRGIAGDFPPEKLKWYNGEGTTAEYAGASTMTREDRKGANLKAEVLRSSASVPSLTAAQRNRREERRDAMEPKGPHHYAPHPGQGVRSLPHFEHSHTLLQHGRDQKAPHTLQHAGVSTFDHRRFYVTNTSMPFL